MCSCGEKADFDACVATAEGDAATATAYGCTNQFDAYIACLRDTVECFDNQLEFDQSCLQLSSSVSDCVSDGSDLD